MQNNKKLNILIATVLINTFIAIVIFILANELLNSQDTILYYAAGIVFGISTTLSYVKSTR